MPSTLASLLHRSLDFAGLFPPASLPVPEALRAFRAEHAANEAGMLSRFVCPVPRLEELAAFQADTTGGLTISALPRGGKNAGEFLANLETDLATIRRLAQLHPGVVTIDTIELRPPSDALAPLALRKFLAAIIALLSRHPGEIRQVFVELTPAPTLAGQLELLAEHAAPTRGNGGLLLGYKLRTGGSGTAAMPSAAQTAAVLASAATLKLPMKCTGGLHHPLRTAATGVPMHGFLNLLVAATLASTAPTEAGVIEAVLEETDPAAFTFEARALSWRDYRIAPAAIAAARSHLLLSFGSCYVAQPRLELQKLGWWPRPTRPKLAQTAK